MRRSKPQIPEGWPSGPVGRVAIAAMMAGWWCGLGSAAPRPVQAQVAAEADTTRQNTPESLNFAHGLLRARRFDLAAEEYERFLQAAEPGPDTMDARLGLAVARYRLGQYQQARGHFEAFLEQAPDDHANLATARFLLGETAYLLGDLPTARQALDAYLANHPEHRHSDLAWLYRGDVGFRLGERETAREAYQNALRAHDEGPLADRARYGLGRTLAALDQTDEAVAVLTTLAESGGPDWTDRARHQLGAVLARAGRLEQAVEAYEHLEQTAPASPLVPEARLRRAEVLIRLERFDEAEALLEPLRDADAPSLASQAFYALGDAQVRQGRAERALATFDEALERFGDSPIAPMLWFRSAEAAARAGQADEARARFLRMAEAYPDDPWADRALLRASGLALEAHDTAEAQRLVARWLRQFGDSPLRAEARLIDARAAMADKQYARAITILDDVLNREQPSPAAAQAARYYLGVAYRASGQTAKAAEILDTLAQTPAAPIATDAQFLVGQAHFESERFAEAIAPLRKYLASKPDGDVADHALAYIALAHLELNQTRQAHETLDELTARFPQSQTLATTRLRLAEAAQTAEQFDRAAELFRQTAETDGPLKARALSGLGWSLLRLDRPGEAADAFADLLDAAPDDPLAPESALARAQALEADGQTDTALAAFALVGQHYADSAQAQPAALARARLLARAGRPAEAADAFAPLVESWPQDQTDGLDDVLAEWGWALLDADQADQADRAFSRLLDQFPDSPHAPDARLNLAESAYENGDDAEVARLLEPLVAEAEAAATADPLAVQAALYRLGRARVRQDDWSAAGLLFDRLITEHLDGPYHREARFWRAEAAYQSGDHETAETGFAALEDETSDEPLAGSALDPAEDWHLTARLRRVQSLVPLQRWAEALERAEALKAAAPDYPLLAEVEYARGRALQGLARFDDAREAYQAVIDARKGGELAALAQLMRGETYFHQKDYREALREFFKVDFFYDAPTWQAAALLQAGKVYEQLAQWADAAETYERLRTKFPDDPSALEAAQRLEAVRKQVAGTSKDTSVVR